jgi:hypothetical protein
LTVSLKMVISLYSLEILAFDLQALFARKIICLPLEVKKLQGSHIVIDIIITFYATPTELLTCFLRQETLMISTAVNKYDSS